MITYKKGAYGLNLLARVRGSAVYKAFFPGMISVAFYVLLQYLYEGRDDFDEVDHPYVLGVLITSISFLIIFRANNSYNRYWEACGAVHHMMSKFLDATVHMAAFHMQCSHYDNVKPPSFYEYPEFLKYNLSRDRHPISKQDAEKRQKMSINPMSSKYTKKIRRPEAKVHIDRPQDAVDTSVDSGSFDRSRDAITLVGPGRDDGGWDKIIDTDLKPTTNNKLRTLACTKRSPTKSLGDTPSMFLKELAHLSSLTVAVAFSTLRCNVEDAESPLGVYVGGSEWPAVDPDNLNENEKAEIQQSIYQQLLCFFGMDRSPNYKTKYNSTRPMLVIGGVSENEVKQLQKARGASAKTQLAWYWLSEFIAREHLAGSSGVVGPPIISRLFQFLSDGMIYYNHARKIMFIPFPFPHAQLAVFFVAVVVFTVPFMMHHFTNNKWLAALLTFLVVTCLAGLHEVARELENPYRNVPNDIPLGTLLANYNESLIAMCSGYHPDAYWREEVDRLTIETEEESDFAPKQVSNDENENNLTKLEETIRRQAKEIEELKIMFQEANLEKNKDM